MHTCSRHLQATEVETVKGNPMTFTRPFKIVKCSLGRGRNGKMMYEVRDSRMNTISTHTTNEEAEKALIIAEKNIK